jgi:TonB family protein
MIEPQTLENLFAYILQSTAVVAVALGALRLLRIHAPGPRYAALRGTLAFAMALPLLQPRVTTETATLSPLVMERNAALHRSPAAGVAPAPITADASPLQGGLWASLAGIVLLVGIAVRLVWLGAGLWRLQRLRSAGEIAAGEEHKDLQQVIGTSAALRYVAGLEQPLTFGFRRPVVLLPASLRRMRPDIQRAVAAHELWHVRRRDWVWMIVEECIRSAFWFHPAVRVLLSRIQVAREETVDDLAILATGSRRSYLDALLAFADARPLFVVSAFARRCHLLQRMLTISKENVMSSKRLVLSCAVVMMAVAATAWSAAAAFPLTGDQNPPRDPRQAPAPQHEMVFVPASVPDMEAAIQREPKNPVHYRMLATHYVKAGDFDSAVGVLEALAQADPSNPQYHHQVGVFYWDKLFRDTALTPDQKVLYIATGMAAMDRALAIDSDYVEALAYKNLFLRLQATLTTDIAEQRRLTAEADSFRSRAMELNKQRRPVARPGDTVAPPPPPPPPPPVGPVDGVMPLQAGIAVPPPVKITDVRPAYPAAAQANGLTGVVGLEVVVDTAGRVRDVRVVRSAPLFDEAAVDAVRQWAFVPTIVDGVARPVVMMVTVSFTGDSYR